MGNTIQTNHCREQTHDVEHVRYEYEGSPPIEIEIELSIDSPTEGKQLQGNQRWRKSVKGVGSHGGADICHGKRKPQTTG
jgi:hypothetical protein